MHTTRPRETFDTEQELAASVVDWLISRQWEVYQEIALKPGSPVADIVAKSTDEPQRVHVVECKLGMTFKLLAQALRWRELAHAVSVAVPWAESPQGSNRFAAYQVCRALGVGVLEVCKVNGDTWVEVIAPVEQENTHAVAFGESLVDMQKDFAAAGNAQGKRWSRDAQTLENLRAYAESNPGEALKYAVRHFDHHYGSHKIANRRLSQRIRDGQVKDLNWKLDGELVVLNPSD